MPYQFYTKRRIEFVDVDLAGFVHFSRFFVFMETAEHEFLRSLGTSVHSRIDGKEIGWPRLACSCEYFSPAKFEDILDIELTVVKKGRTSMTYQVRFLRDKTFIARGLMSSICCIIDPVKGIKPIRIPAFISEQIQPAKKSKK
jgi:acyl-CoA thioester hydrolase